MGPFGVGDAQVIGQIPDPELQGCFPCQERKALCTGRQILLSQIQTVPGLGIGQQIGRTRCFVAVLFWQWEYGNAPVPQGNCVTEVQDMTLCDGQLGLVVWMPLEVAVVMAVVGLYRTHL